MVSTDSTIEASENASSSESGRMAHNPFPGLSQARTPIHPHSSSDSESDDDSETLAPPPKTQQQQEQKKEHQPKKQKKQQPPQKQKEEQPPPPSPSALRSNKTAPTKALAKRPREEENDGIPEPPSTKKRRPGHTVQHSDEVPAKEKKKAQKQNVAETVSTPSSPQKSAKKALQVWNSKDELAFLNGVLAFTKGGKEFPKNMSPVYDYVRNMMHIDYSNKQFREKLRRLKAKFLSLMENMRVNNYSFKSTDEATMYKLCKQLWDVQDEGDHDDGDDEHCHIAETVGNASMNGKDKEKKKKDEEKKKKQPVEAEEKDRETIKDGEDQGEEEEDGEKIKDGEEEEDGEKTKDGEDQGEEEKEGQDEPTCNKTMANALVKCNAGDVERISRELYSKLRKEMNDMVNEMRNTVVTILKEYQANTRVMVHDYILSTRADHVQPPYSDMMTRIHTGRPAPVLTRANAEALEEKWRKQQIAEKEVVSRRLGLLQDEREMCLEGLRASVSSGRS